MSGTIDRALRWLRAKLGLRGAPLLAPKLDRERAFAELEAVERRFAATPWLHYRKLDAEHRSRTWTSPPWFTGWHQVAPADLPELARGSIRPATLAGLLSMHPSGFLREASVRALADEGDPRAIPFLLIRTGDWVRQVREAAEHAVERRLAERGLGDFLPAAPLLAALARESSRGGELASRLVARLARESDGAALRAGLVGADFRLARACARFLVERGEAAEVLALALAQHDPVAALTVAAGALAADGASEATLCAVASSRRPKLRAVALACARGSDPAQARSACEAGLFDASRQVRHLAQHFGAELGLDPRQRYLDALATRPVAIHGLAEAGGPADAERIRPFLDDARPELRAAALEALHRWRAPGSAEAALAHLDDPHPTPRRSAWRVLRRERLAPEALEIVWDLARSSDGELPHRRAFAVFARQERWTAMYWACRALATGDAALVDGGRDLLAVTWARWNKSWNPPAGDLLAELRTLEGAAARALPARDVAHLRDLLRRAG